MRNRIIKEGFFRSYELAQLPPLARIMFEGLWCMADKEGRLWDRPHQIKAECLPYDECDPDNFLQQLHDAKFILRYEVQDRKCIQIVNFTKHQTLTTWENKNTESDIPSSEVLLKSVSRSSKRSRTESKRTEQTEQSRTEEGATASPSLPDWLDGTLWRRWLKHRKEIKHPVTEEQAAGQIRKLEDLRARGHPPESVIEYSIAGGYQGLFEPKEGNANGRQNGASKVGPRTAILESRDYTVFGNSKREAS